MDFREASDALCKKIDHADLAEALGVSLQSVRQARLPPATKARREPPKQWARVMIRLAEQEIMRNRRIIEQLHDEAVHSA